MTQPVSTTNFTGTDRFELVRQLGAGGMGVVYEAIDRQRDARVALKSLPNASPSALFAFKQEFRTLANVSHPNLIGLYELFSEGEQWFFTMELVDGVDLATFILGEPAQLQNEMPVPELNESLQERLRSTLRQVVEGISEIHSHGLLHRDIKPQNVLVRKDGRVVVLDFGLVSERLAASNDPRHIVGTVAYMSPEQAEGAPLSPASDWYCVGAMLYQVLTGRCPFEGDITDILNDKRSRSPAQANTINPAISDDLNKLIKDLLSRNPLTRPNAVDLLRWCDAADGLAMRSFTEMFEEDEAPQFVGRHDPLDQMSQDFEAVRAGGTAVVLVRGESGTGKTALVQHFIEGLPLELEPVVLTGRCYEQESVPFKAFDSLIDMLTRYLERLSESELAALLPRDVAALGRIFPVVQRIAAIANAPSRAATAPDQVELRRRGFAALSEMLGRIGDRHPLILMIDDLQWGDADSANLFNELLKPPDPPVMLVLGTYRSEDEDRSECLRLLNAAATADQSLVSRRVITLSPLSGKESIELAIGLLDRNDPNAQAEAEQIALESSGSPYFLSELAQHVRDGIRRLSKAATKGTEPTTAERGSLRIRLNDALWRRIERLPENASQVLEVLSVASRPLRVGDALKVARVRDSLDALSRLRNDRFLRATFTGGDEFLAPYHDRIRETITDHLTEPQKRELHLRLADELQASGQLELPVIQAHLDRVEEFAHASEPLPLEKQQYLGVFDLAYHFDRAGEPARAFPYALAAAEQARAQYSLGAAEQNFRIALVGAERAGQAARFRVVEGLADVLMLRGRYAETAIELNHAREFAHGPDAEAVKNISVARSRIEAKLGELSFKRGELKMAMQHHEQALRMLGRPVAPQSQLLLLPMLLLEAAKQVLHTYFPSLFVGRKKLKHSQTDLLAVRLYDRLCYAYWFSRGTKQTLWAHLRQLNLAERYPPTLELAQAYSVHAPVMCSLPNFQRGIRYAQKSLKIREDLGDAWGQGQSLEFYGVVLLAAADYEGCLEKSQQGARLLEQTGDIWELNMARYHIAASHFRLGNMREAVEIARQVYNIGEELGDIQATAINLTMWALASEGDVPEELMRIEYERERADMQTKVQSIITKGLWLLAHETAGSAAAAFQEALELAKKAGLNNHYVLSSHALLAGALRQHAMDLREQSPSQVPAALSRAKTAARRAVKVGRTFPTDLPRSLRELGLIELAEGNPVQAQRLFAESLELAVRHKARYEQALTVVALAQLAQATGQPDALQNLQQAQIAVDALRYKPDAAAPTR